MEFLTHPEAQAFLAAIRSNEAEDTPRLVFADWLDELSDPVAAAWASIIRGQIAVWHYWPKPGRPGTWDELPSQEAERAYYQFEQAMLGPMEVMGKVFARTGRTNDRMDTIEFVRGFPYITADMPDIIRFWSTRNYWEIFNAVRIENPGMNKFSRMSVVINRNTLTRLKFGDGCPFRAALSVLGTIDYRTVTNLKRLEINVRDFGLDEADRLLGLPIVRAPGMTVTVSPRYLFTRGAIEQMREALGNRFIFSARASARTPQPYD